MEIRRLPKTVNEFEQTAQTYNVIPVYAEILADMETPVSILKRFYDQHDTCFLFESVEGGEKWARYSFLGTSAAVEFKVYPKNIEVRDFSGVREVAHNGQPLDTLRKLMNHYKAYSAQHLPRFQGGIVGYMNYEMVSFFEPRLGYDFAADTLLAHFVIPGELIIFDSAHHTLFAIALAFKDAQPNAAAAFADAQQRLNKLLAEIQACAVADDRNGVPSVEYKLEPSMKPETFRQMVAKTIEYIGEGEIIQGVISQPFFCDTPPDAFEFYRAQRYINPSPYMFFVKIGAACLVGSSPETMVRLENGAATMRPIAGTRPRGLNEQEDLAFANALLADEKEIAEHMMLVDLGRNDLGRVAEIGSVQVTELMTVERYSHVMHLVSNIVCDLKENHDAFDLIKASFPAGTLSGAPKVRAMEIIKELEPTLRGPYGGALGYIAFSGNMDLAITIRTACFENGRIRVQAGGGVVADSVPENERQETINKSKSLAKALQLLSRTDA